MKFKTNLTKIMIALFVIFLIWFAIRFNENKTEEETTIYDSVMSDLAIEEPNRFFWVFDCSDSEVQLILEKKCYPNILTCVDGCINPKSDYVFKGFGGPSAETVGLSLCENGKIIKRVKVIQ